MEFLIGTHLLLAGGGKTDIYQPHPRPMHR
jgi:hypothetical protein